MCGAVRCGARRSTGMWTRDEGGHGTAEPAVQDYLKAIFQLTEEGGSGAAITTSQVAEALSVTTA